MTIEAMEHGTPTGMWREGLPYRQRVLWTDVAMRDPQVGDAFTEMMSYWVYVVAVDGDTVEWLDGNPPCTFPTIGVTRHISSKEEFRARFAYECVDGYWITLMHRGVDVEGWATP